MRGVNKTRTPNRKGKGKLIEKDNDIILQMEHDYGGIRKEQGYSNEKQDFVRNLICATCGYTEETVDSVKRHLAISHRQMGKVKDLFSPFCHDTFSHVGSLNRHIH